MKNKFLLLLLFILLFSNVSALTEEERLRNNRIIEGGLVEDVDVVGVIGIIDSEGNFEVNPFLILGLFVGVIILLIVIIKIISERERI